MKKRHIGFSLLGLALVFIPLNTYAISIFPVSSKGTAVQIFFPDVCTTPAPAGPIPVPYPEFSFTDIGSGKVKIDGKHVATKDSSYGGTTGDEEGTIVSIRFAVFLDETESSDFSIFLADPNTGESLGAEFEFFVSESTPGEVNFDLSNYLIDDFDIRYVLTSKDTGAALNSKFTIEKMEFIGVSFADGSASPVPEPATMLLLVIGLAGVAGVSRKKFKKLKLIVPTRYR
jgi:hypothetical protein